MDPLSRKLFQSRDAREKLRQQGGIMASSPELAQTVAKFANGGPTELQIPRVRSAIQEGGISYPSWRMMSRSQREELGYPMSEIGGQLAFDRFGVGLGLVDPASRFSPSGLNVSEVRPDTTGTGENMPRGRNAPRRPMTAEEAYAASNEFAGMGPDVVPPGTADVAVPDVAVPDEEAERIAADTRRVLQEPGPAPEKALPEEEPVVTPPKTDDDEDTDTRDLFDMTYDKMMSRLERVMGTETDEDKKKQAMANLAMIGLAIAAGQSPDALTNIAQGALVGMQGIQAAKADEKKSQRELRKSAFDATNDYIKALMSGGKDRFQKAEDYSDAIRMTASDFMARDKFLTADEAYRMAEDYVSRLPAYADVAKDKIYTRPGVTTTASDVPAVGDIVDGHKFLGGGPGDQKNWEKVE